MRPMTFRSATAWVILGFACAAVGFGAGYCACSGPAPGSEAAAVETQQPGGVEMVQISSSEAAKNGLPPAAITVEPGKTGMTARAFPEKNRYLMLSGPPGGPLGMKIDAYSGTSADAAGLEKLLKARFGEDSPEKGSFGQVELGGAPRAAMSCASGTSQARAAHLVTLFPVAAGADRGVLVDFWVGSRQTGVPAPAAFLGMPTWGDVLRSLRIRFE